eukprot:gene13251-15576_t
MFKNILTTFVITLTVIVAVASGDPSMSPKQVHMSLGNDPSSIRVTWITTAQIFQPTLYCLPGPCGEKKDKVSSPLLTPEEKSLIVLVGSSKTYYPYDGLVHSVAMNGLKPSQTYCYSVGGHPLHTENNFTTSWSVWREFNTVPSSDLPVTFAAIADCGTWGGVFPVMKALAEDKDITMFIHEGDLAYGLNESTWDLYGDIIEPVASKIPYMPLAGNWDVKAAAVLAYTQRYPMPLPYPTPNTTLVPIAANGTDVPFSAVTYYNLFYSFSYSHVYIIALSSFEPYDSNSLQYKWFEEELKNVNRTEHPWVIASSHTPLYTSSTGHNGSDITFREAIEPLLKKYDVNLYVAGHDHCYERTYPVLKAEVLNSSKDTYTTEQGTVHILVGTGGADQDTWLEQPVWSAHRELSVGYTKIKADKHTMDVTFLRVNGTVGDHFTITHIPKATDVPTNKVNENSSPTRMIMTIEMLMLLAIVWSIQLLL